MSNTRNKFNEAQFFLKLMDLNSNVFPDFNYYVSAFISIARSVTWVMKCEYKDRKGWQEWHDLKEPTKVDTDFLKMINEIRLTTTKRQPIQTNFSVTLDIPPKEITPELTAYFKSLKPSELAEFIANAPTNNQHKEVGDRSVLPFTETIKTTMYLDGFPKKDIREIGHKYMEELNCLIEECESKFAL